MDHTSTAKKPDTSITQGPDQPESQPKSSLDFSTPMGIERMNEFHEAVKSYLGGKVSLAPLEEYSPKTILDMGSGSGAWAIQAAAQFPEADVLAVDLSPLPSRPLPPNLRFQILDITKPCPFAPQTFDILHARSVFIHIPKFEEVLERTMQLVKPGGWLLLEDIETVFPEDSGGAPNQKGYKLFQQHMSTNNMNRRAGSAFQGILESSGLFSEVNVRKIVLPVSKCDEAQMDDGARLVTKSFKGLLKKFLLAQKEKVAVTHFRLEDIEAAEELINDPSGDMQAVFYMTWSRRRDQ